VRAPVRFFAENLVWSGRRGDVWACYRLATASYPERSRAQKLALLGDVSTLCYALERDLQLLRVTRALSPDGYLEQARACADPRHARGEELERYLEAHAKALGGHEVARPECYLAVRIAGAQRSRGERVAAPRAGGPLATRLRRTLAPSAAHGISARTLDALRRDEEQVLALVASYLACERATSEELSWLCRRASLRGAGEPPRAGDWRPQALVVSDERGEALLRPLEHDVLRLFEAPITASDRGIVIGGERADSHQALLCLGALPEELPFPDPRAELLFAPLEALTFPVDACLWARHVPNRDALRLVRRRVVDADHQWAEEALGAHGPWAHSRERPQAARALEEILASPERPPLLRASVSLAVGAPSAEELERRVADLRQVYGGIELHRPLGEQLRLWCAHLPGQRAPVPDYEDLMLVEHVGAMVPTATHQVGTECGPYLGHTLSGSRQPVLFDLADAAQDGRSPAICVLGRPGGGKTLLLETLLYQAFLAGSLVVDIDPKGDHHLAELPGVAGALEVIELAGTEKERGLLDPLLIAPEELREEVAASFLLDLLPAPVPPDWRTEVRRAVQEARRRDPHATCCSVLAELAGSEESAARQAARALQVHAESGLARLGFAEAGWLPPTDADAPLTQLLIRNLPRIAPGTPAEALTEEQRIGRAVLRLICRFAMHLMSGDRSRHKVIGIDEAFFLLEDPLGQQLLTHLNRWGRSEFASAILVTHLVADAAGLENLVGARFVFGMAGEDEAREALRLLGCDPDDERLVQRLLSFERGRCLLRDFEGHVGAMQVAIPDPAMLAALDTTPGRGRGGGLAAA